MKKLTKKLLGHCPVDSGQLLIIDPCYLGEWKDGEYEMNGKGAKDGNHYDKCCQLNTEPNNLGNDGDGGEVLVSGVAGNGVTFPSGYGDGHYPVYGYFNDEGRCVRVVIDCDITKEQAEFFDQNSKK